MRTGFLLRSSPSIRNIFCKNENNTKKWHFFLKFVKVFSGWLTLLIGISSKYFCDILFWYTLPVRYSKLLYICYSYDLYTIYYIRVLQFSPIGAFLMGGYVLLKKLFDAFLMIVFVVEIMIIDIRCVLCDLAKKCYFYNKNYHEECIEEFL